MVTETRATVPAVKDSLLAHGERYSYFQALRLLRLFEKNTGAARSENLRIRPKLALNFPENDIDAIEVRPQGGYRITANFFGLYGVASPLPTYYTEDLFEEERNGGHVMREFIDIVHYTLYPHLFGAWSKYRLEQRVVEDDDQLVLNHLYAFVGLDDPELRIKLLPHSAELLRYAALLNVRPRSALGLQTMLADAFEDATVRIDSCVLRSVAIPADQRCQLGAQGTSLGEDSYLGSHVDDYAGNLRIVLSDLPHALFQQLLPAAAACQKLKFLTRFYLTDPLEVEVELRLRQDDVRGTRLNSLEWSRLGLDTWLSPEQAQRAACISFNL
ncbi:type VI secretion system baseplate subunit TssG [Janthinobacterium sp. PC23-8]|uniref:type VI secretion system baseplate subunit TssG n=1 Tax=Janthinobacterium sp. PC23-8 TaxID=2012679 RepID=UPI000B95E289|nr:type VI secretion system baseplate subunit TssG [Janthinobacterium sp. PC23-8]OYO27931.1 type VI secretion protein [Janthinobacterium sp. PC23-8]